MFQNLSERLTQSLRSITGKSRITEDNIQGTLREVRMALLEADVALPVVKQFVEAVKQRALGQEVMSSLSPGQAFLKIVQAELERSWVRQRGLDLAAQPPAVILLAGLQGAGKTTSAAKLARLLKEREGKKVTVVSADVYRPAAIKQLETLAGEVGVDFFPSTAEQKPVDIATRRASTRDPVQRCADRRHGGPPCGRRGDDGRDRGTGKSGQARRNAVRRRRDDRSGRGEHGQSLRRGAAPDRRDPYQGRRGQPRRCGPVRAQMTGKPIKFLGVGEKTEALDPFHPDRLASRILGMGDMLSLIEEAEQKVDRKKAEKLARKVKKGKKFDLEDLRDQLQQMNNMGGMASMLDKMPGMGGMAQMAQAQMDNKTFARMEAMINSMTPRERRNPELIQGSRKRRITRGSGTQVQDLNRLLKQHKQMAKMMKKMKGGGMEKMMRGLGGMMPPGGGGMPPMR
jgi:signal recognition particle subunit SRP54